MMSSDADTDALVESVKYGYSHGKNISIIRSSTAIVSVAASCLLIWILYKTRDRFSTTYHSLLLGMSISDILYSFSCTSFGAVVPSELSYTVWNAQGNLASCSSFGFINILGYISSILYSCSLNIYYLAVIRYQKPPSYIKRKMEWKLHAVPVVSALIIGVVFLVRDKFNPSMDGVCNGTIPYNFPHCEGYEDGEIVEGFRIPCGKGGSVDAFQFIVSVTSFAIGPIIVGVSFIMIYRSVKKTERRMARYAVERDDKHSRSVLNRAAAYSMSYFVTWIWYIVSVFLVLAHSWPRDFPRPTWQIGYLYVYNFFCTLQGLWNLLIFLLPKVWNARKLPDGTIISWPSAFANALWSAVTGRKVTGVFGATRKQKKSGAARENASDNPRVCTTQRTALTISESLGKETICGDQVDVDGGKTEDQDSSTVEHPRQTIKDEEDGGQNSSLRQLVEAQDMDKRVYSSSVEEWTE